LDFDLTFLVVLFILVLVVLFVDLDDNFFNLFIATNSKSNSNEFFKGIGKVRSVVHSEA